MALSDTAVRQARITGTDYSLGDTDGLALNVTARGGKIWYFRYYWAGKQKRMSLGGYPQISLKEARARRDEARAWLLKASTLMSIVNSSVVQFAAQRSTPLKRCLINGSRSVG